MAESTEKTAAAPYVSFTTFKNKIKELGEGGRLPDRIDASCLPNMAGGTQGQLLVAFRYLGLIDDEGVPDARMHSLAKSSDKDWTGLLRQLLHDYYRQQIAILEKNGTPAQLRETFTKGGASGSVADKGIRFFLKAAEDASIPIPPAIEKGVKTGSGGSRKRAVRRRATDSPAESGNDGPPPPSSDKSVVIIPLPLPGGREAKLTVPRDLTVADVAMLRAGMAMAEALAQSNTDSDD